MSSAQGSAASSPVKAADAFRYACLLESGISTSPPAGRLVFYTEAKASDASIRQQPPRRAHCCSEVMTLATQGLRAEGNGVTNPLFPPTMRVARSAASLIF